jgi:hypothetical protein
VPAAGRELLARETTVSMTAKLTHGRTLARFPGLGKPPESGATGAGA